MAENAANSTTATTATEVTTSTEATNPTTESSSTQEAQVTQETSKPLTAEDVERMVQSGVDKATAEYGKKISALKKENEELKRKNLSDEERKNLEIADRDNALAERERKLNDRENRIFASKVLREVGLDDGSTRSLELVDLVMSDTEENIEKRAKTLKSLVDALVKSEVEKTFRTHGRVPNGANISTESKESDLAARLGKDRAEQNKKANDVLSHYIGGKK